MRAQVKRSLALAAAITALILRFALPVSASGADNEAAANERAREVIEGFYDELPDSAREYVDSAEADSLRPAEGIISLINSMLADFKENIKQPLKLLGLTVGAAALCALANAACAGAEGARTVRLCGAALCAVCACSSLSSLIEEAAAAAERSAGFTAAFVPVFAGLLVSSGLAGTGAFYSAAVMGAQSVFANLITTLAKPLAGVLLALSVAASVRQGGGLEALAAGVKKAALWIVGGASALFCGVVRVQTLVTASSDSLALRASRFALSSAVPIVGRSVSEALSTLSGALSMIRSAAGTAGILAVAGIFAPIALRCILCSAALSLASMLCDMLDMSPSARAIAGMKSGVDILCAVVVFNALCLIISTAALIGTAGGAA